MLPAQVPATQVPSAAPVQQCSNATVHNPARVIGPCNGVPAAREQQVPPLRAVGTYLRTSASSGANDELILALPVISADGGQGESIFK